MQTTLWEQLQPHIVNALVLLIPAAGATVAAWLQHKRTQWASVKRAVWEAEQVGKSDPGIRGDAKREIALAKLKQSNPGMSESKAVTLIERAVPQVRLEAAAIEVDPDPDPPPLPPRRR